MVLLRATQIGFEGTNRGDFELGFLTHHPEVELITPPRLIGIGFDRREALEAAGLRE